jgi:hypothetical protein
VIFRTAFRGKKVAPLVLQLRSQKEKVWSLSILRYNVASGSFVVNDQQSCRPNIRPKNVLPNIRQPNIW